MSIKTFLETLLPSIKRADVSNVLINIVERINGVSEAYDDLCRFKADFKFKSDEMIQFSKDYNYVLSKKKGFKGNFIKTTKHILDNLKDFAVRAQTEGLLDEGFTEVFSSNQLKAKQIQILAIIQSMDFFVTYAHRLISFFYLCELTTATSNPKYRQDYVTERQIKYLRDFNSNFMYISNAFLSSNYVEIHALLDAIPDILVTPKDLNMIESTYGSGKVNPIIKSGFISAEWNPFRIVGSYFVEWNHHSYLETQKRLQACKAKLMMLKNASSNNGIVSPKQEMIIANYEGEIQTLEAEIEDYKLKVMGYR